MKMRVLVFELIAVKACALRAFVVSFLSLLWLRSGAFELKAKERGEPGANPRNVFLTCCGGVVSVLFLRAF